MYTGNIGLLFTDLGEKKQYLGFIHGGKAQLL